MNTAKVSNPTETLSHEVNSLVRSVQCAGEEGGFFEMNYDLLALAFRELVGSDFFSTLDAARRVDLLGQYQKLRVLLDDLSDFNAQFPDWIDMEVYAKPLRSICTN